MARDINKYQKQTYMRRYRRKGHAFFQCWLLLQQNDIGRSQGGDTEARKGTIEVGHSEQLVLRLLLLIFSPP